MLSFKEASLFNGKVVNMAEQIRSIIGKSELSNIQSDGISSSKRKLNGVLHAKLRYKRSMNLPMIDNLRCSDGSSNNLQIEEGSMSKMQLQD